MFFSDSFNQDIGTNVVTVNVYYLYSMWIHKCDKYWGLCFMKIYLIIHQLNNWNTSKVTNIDNTFFWCYSF
jgi:hypothetical protein